MKFLILIALPKPSRNPPSPLFIVGFRSGHFSASTANKQTKNSSHFRPPRLLCSQHPSQLGGPHAWKSARKKTVSPFWRKPNTNAALLPSVRSRWHCCMDVAADRKANISFLVFPGPLHRALETFCLHWKEREKHQDRTALYYYCQWSACDEPADLQGWPPPPPFVETLAKPSQRLSSTAEPPTAGASHTT